MMRWRALGAIMGLVALAVGLVGCSPPTESPATPTGTPTPTRSEVIDDLAKEITRDAAAVRRLEIERVTLVEGTDYEDEDPWFDLELGTFALSLSRLGHALGERWSCDCVQAEIGGVLLSGSNEMRKLDRLRRAFYWSEDVIEHADHTAALVETATARAIAGGEVLCGPYRDDVSYVRRCSDWRQRHER